ncbi:ATP-dependent helicase HrpB [Tateyamaria sp. ANG-S1]|uniref:ATP-dependent helicase HrpB n=1 Tax=Tateyamaria sp. ANG-S1 TaxID=1577905 RepID=UPI00057EA82B|nr:ATP-dependent helicase HrpB [Tateyamaria sp. ANG-S1]KIC51212.1 ATP-dependent helicase [Tateyamaria sp. ANG-S1]
MSRLPIDDILPDLVDTLRTQGRAVLQAPPGAGKTTRVPLAMLEAGLTQGRILMLEPRRLAARNAAERMAQTLGEKTGQTVGYRIRGQSAVSKATRIEVVTEGILTRMLQDAPDLPGVGAVIFDEFHERSLNADLGLALCLEVAEALRDDLILLAMSATLDAAPVAEVMQAPILTSEGRSFPVEPRWLDAPVHKAQRFEAAMADLIRSAYKTEPRSLLAFLPGEGEIKRTAALLSDLPNVQPLYGAMDFKAQRAAVTPSDERKIVLATSIAETSLTIPDIRIVVDGGRARRAQFDPSSGMSRLITERVTRAEATQRAGRAGRVAPGVAYKLWTKGEDGALAAFPPPEITAGDLSTFALELAIWGARETDLRFVTAPHEGRLAEARNLLHMLGALDSQGRITDHGRLLARQPLHPRLAHMLVKAGRQAAPIAALLADRDPLRGLGVDLNLRLRAIKKPTDFGGAVHHGAVARIRDEATRLAKGHNDRTQISAAAMAALAYPDRIGKRRPGDAPRYVLSGGKGAILPDADGLAGQTLIVATDLDGNPREAKIRQAAALSLSELEDLFPDQIAWSDTCHWSKRDGAVLARTQRQFGALVLDNRPWHDAPDDAIARAMLDGVRQLGLLPSKGAQRLLARAALMADDFPDTSPETLMQTLDDWLLPHLSGVRSAADWKGFDILPALQSHLGWNNMQRLDKSVPGHFETPLGRRVPIDYDDAVPGVSVRLQEMFGVTRHPMVGKAPLQITLLSPAQRPVQVTSDLPGFWATSYADVRKDMRGRYPKHPWPEDPTEANPTLRAKPRQ